MRSFAPKLPCQSHINCLLHRMLSTGICREHIYTALTWKSALQCDPIIPSPEGCGWIVSAQYHLQIYWTSLPPAPDAVLNKIPCACTKSKCAAGGCSCLSVCLKCTDLCKCKNYENTLDESDNSDDNFDEDEIDTDSSNALK